MDYATLERARRGDEWALQRLYAESNGRVFRLVLFLVDDPQSAEELMQDTLYYALTHLDDFNPDRSQWSTWLHTIAVSRCRNYLRRRRFVTLPFRWLSELLHHDHSPSAIAEQGELAGKLHAALLSLSPKCREALALHFLEKYSFPEMGRILGCSAKTAQSRVRIGLEGLRKTIARDVTWQGLYQTRESQPGTTLTSESEVSYE